MKIYELKPNVLYKDVRTGKQYIINTEDKSLYIATRDWTTQKWHYACCFASYVELMHVDFALANDNL